MTEPDDDKALAADQEEIKRAERRAASIRMRNAGASLGDISKKMGVSYRTTQRDIEQGLKELLREPAEEMIANQRAILRDMRRALYVSMMGGDKDAISSMMKTLDHEARLFGLYAPARVNVGVSDEEFALTAAKLMSEIGVTPPPKLRELMTGDTAPGTEVVAPMTDAPTVLDDGVDPNVIDAESEDHSDDPWVV